MYHLFSYLARHGIRCIAFDPSIPQFDADLIILTGCEKFYEVKEKPVPSDAPEPRGAAIKMSSFVGASHASNKVTFHSHTGIFILINNSLIVWYSKRQILEPSTFRSKFVALHVATELVQGNRYKLRMFGVPISSPMYLRVV